MEQLLMYHLMEEFEDFPIPEGWTLRTYRPGDEVIWTRICENGLSAPDDGTLRDWRCAILNQKSIVPERDVFFICRENDIPEATLTAYVDQSEGFGDIHMVAAAPSIRGNNVNRMMLAHGMRKLDKEMPNRPRYTELTTDDFRLPAIVGYLKSGFRPVVYDNEEEMIARWKKVCDELNIHGIEMLNKAKEGTGIIL